jgi:signal transduction histidine kinase/DNA-binding response OmpR family regulator
MNNSWEKKRLEIMTLSIFFILLLTSIFFLYNAYTNYTLLIEKEENTKAFIYQVTMFISSIILFFSLLIVYLKRDYFFLEEKHDTVALENLLEEIKHSSDKEKIKQFKQMLKEEKHTEIYRLISKMITELHESQRAIEEANKIKTLFVSNISHELRTPITGILGFTDVLSSTKIDKEQREFIKIIRKSSKELLTLVNNILDISQLENGKLNVKNKRFNLMEEFEKIIDIYTFDVMDKEIDFHVWIDPEFNDIYLYTDIEKVKQIVMNLISNAIKFTDNGGKVELNISKKASSSKSCIDIEFLVSDNGIGIDDEHKKTVFRLFNQADSSNTRAYTGIGLGLTIADRLVKLLDSNLHLESELGKGTKVSFSLSLKYEKNFNKKENNLSSIAVYAPKDTHKSQTYKHLIAYLSENSKNSVHCFDTFVECKDAKLDSFDILYIYYDKINVDELKRVVALYSLEKNIVLLTKMLNREKILDISPIFTEVIYEPVTFLKIADSLRHKKTISSLEEDKFILNVLIVEDNVINQKVIKHTLKSLGISADIANNGEKGLDMFKKNQYDMVFMDIQMPVMNGVVATKEMIAYEERCNLDHTPIIAVTTNALKGDRELYLKSGMDEYIAKPISTDKFVSVIKQFYSPKKESTKKITQLSKDILLYKKVPTEAKVLSSLLNGLDYHVDLAKSREEFYYKMKNKNYKLFLLDKNSSNREDEVLMNEIIGRKMPTLFLMGEKSILSADDINEYTKVMYEKSNFMDIHEQIEKMMEL